MYNNILVIGANGKTGSRVIKRLGNQGIATVAASRSSGVLFNWDAPQTWHHAIKGANAVYLTYYPDLAAPKAPNHIRCFCKLAMAEGVKHVTLLSGRGEPTAQECEIILKQSGLAWTIVRASWFNQNFSEVLDGRNEYICDGVKQALGREPRNFNQFIHSNLDLFEVDHAAA